VGAAGDSSPGRPHCPAAVHESLDAFPALWLLHGLDHLQVTGFEVHTSLKGFGF